MSYLDLLKDDNMEMIFKYATDDLEQTILKLSKNINKLKLRLRPLSINYYSEEDYIDIRYDNVVYSMDNYLFNTFQDEEDLSAIQFLSAKPCIVIIKYFNEYFSNGDGMTFISNKLKSPTYLDILIEANKAVLITDDYHHVFLEGIARISNEKLLNYFNIRPNKYINYYEFIMGS
jgi:hypothetical protein